MDYYKVLGVDKSASPEEIKKAFHRLAHKFHPHKGGDEKKFKEINEAYQILSDKEKRAQYDKYGRVFERGAGPGQGFDGWTWGRPFGGEGGPEMEFDFNDIGGIGDIFEDFFGFNNGRKGKKADIKKGKDIKIDIEIDLESAVLGFEKEIMLKKFIACPRCVGTGAEPNTSVKECASCGGGGQVQQVKKTIFGSFTQWAICPQCNGEGLIPEKPCNVCSGEGRIKGEKAVKISIPAGIDSNQVIKIKGEGNAGKRLGEAGNLYVQIQIRRHPVFERKGDDLFTISEISFSQAVLGDEIPVPTIDSNDIFLKIPPGTQSGKVFRISGKGVPHFNGFGKGHMFVEISIKIPKKLTKEQKELLRKLKEKGI